MLELDILLKPEQEVEVIQVLKSTEEGRIMYDALCERQLVLQQLVSLLAQLGWNPPRESRGFCLRYLP